MSVSVSCQKTSRVLLIPHQSLKPTSLAMQVLCQTAIPDRDTEVNRNNQVLVVFALPRVMNNCCFVSVQMKFVKFMKFSSLKNRDNVQSPSSLDACYLLLYVIC